MFNITNGYQYETQPLAALHQTLVSLIWGEA